MEAQAAYKASLPTTESPLILPQAPVPQANPTVVLPPVEFAGDMITVLDDKPNQKIKRKLQRRYAAASKKHRGNGARVAA
jgi:hypothetical protein